MVISSQPSPSSRVFSSMNDLHILPLDLVLSLLVGVGLSAACGFRVFVPPLILSIAGLTGQLHLAHGFEWIGTYPALITFAAATLLEIAGYYVPWLDHALDVLATPAAIIAGTVITAAMVQDVSPFLRWTLAVIAGGGIAGLIQGLTVTARGVSSALTGGLGNPLVATAELGGSLLTAVLALLTPVIALGFLLLLLVLIVRRIRRPAPAAVSAV